MQGISTYWIRETLKSTKKIKISTSWRLTKFEHALDVICSSETSEMAPLTDSKQQDRLLQGMIELYDNQVLTDVILVAEGKGIACHRSVLAASSLYFRYDCSL